MDTACHAANGCKTLEVDTTSMRYGIGVTAYCGLWGSGKTLFMAKEALMLQKQGVKIYSNFGMKGAEHIETFDDLIAVCAEPGRQRRHIALDELGMLLPARDYNKWPGALNIIWLQGRKFGISISYSVQDFMLVDSNVRRVTGKVCNCRGLGNFIKTSGKGEPLETRPALFLRTWYLGSEYETSSKRTRLAVQISCLPKEAANCYDTYALVETCQRVLQKQVEALSKQSVIVVQGGAA